MEILCDNGGSNQLIKILTTWLKVLQPMNVVNANSRSAINDAQHMVYNDACLIQIVAKNLCITCFL